MSEPNPNLTKIVTGDYLESQKSLGCGRHSLNNLFGENIFVENDSKVITRETFKTLTRPIGLQNICHFVHSVGLVVDQRVDSQQAYVRLADGMAEYKRAQKIERLSKSLPTRHLGHQAFVCVPNIQCECLGNNWPATSFRHITKAAVVIIWESSKDER